MPRKDSGTEIGEKFWSGERGRQVVVVELIDEYRRLQHDDGVRLNPMVAGLSHPVLYAKSWREYNRRGP